MKKLFPALALLCFALSAYGSWSTTPVNSGTAFASTNPVSTTAFANPSVSGSCIVVGVFATQTFIPTPTDTFGDTFVDAGPGIVAWNSSLARLEIFKAPNTHTTAGNIISFANAGGNDFGVSVVELTGGTSGCTVDKHSANPNATSTSGINNVTSGAATTTINGDYIFGFVANIAGHLTAGTGFTQLAAPDFISLSEYQVQGTAGSIAATWNDTNGSGDIYGAAMIALEPSTAPATVMAPTNVVAFGFEGGTPTPPASTVGCGAVLSVGVLIATDESQCGNVGNAYAGYPGGVQPAATGGTISSCQAIAPASAGLVYRLTANIGSSATTACITEYYGYFFILDLNGFTITGMVQITSNAWGYVVMGGTINCNSSTVGCVDIYEGGASSAYTQIHHLTINQEAMGGRCVNFNMQNAYSASSTRYLQIWNNQGTLPNINDTGGTRSYFIWAQLIGGPTAEVWNNTFSPGGNANDVQVVTMFESPGSYVHNNYFVLPHPLYSTGTYDTDRAILFDCQSGSTTACTRGGNNIAEWNVINADFNRALRVRAETGDQLIYNIVTDCRYAAIDGGCFMVGDPDFYQNASGAEIANNNIEIQDGYAIYVGGSSYMTANVHNNTFTCFSNDCSHALWAAVAQAEDTGFPSPIAGPVLTTKNNVYPPGWSGNAEGGNSVMICGPAGNPAYACGVATDTASGIWCNDGPVVGNGTISHSCP